MTNSSKGRIRTRALSIASPGILPLKFFRNSLFELRRSSYGVAALGSLLTGLNLKQHGAFLPVKHVHH